MIPQRLDTQRSFYLKQITQLLDTNELFSSVNKGKTDGCSIPNAITSTSPTFLLFSKIHKHKFYDCHYYVWESSCICFYVYIINMHNKRLHTLHNVN